MEKIKCLIIGSGPAGYTAAIYAARANLSPVLYTGMEPGGQLMLTTEVENFPGYPTGVQGPQLMEDLRNQAERYGTEIRYELVSKIDFSGETHKVTTDSGHEIEANAVIIATGASAKWLGLESEKRLMNKGVSACAVCDGFFFRGQEVAIVGGGDTAAEEAIYLSKMCSTVHMLVRRDELRASRYMAEKVASTSNIIMHWNTEILEVLGKEVVDGIKVIDNKSRNENTIPVTGLFVAIGHKPNTDIFKGYIELDSVGYIKTIPGTSKTNIEGVFACGDVQDSVYRQAVTAAGTGCMAALDAERYLVKKGIE